MSMFEHETVLKQEAVDGLHVKKGEKYIDCTFGGGGHSAEILSLGGLVLGLDVDAGAIEHAKSAFAQELDDNNLFLVQENFLHIDEAVERIGWKEGEIAGIIYDLGMSTFQIKQSQRGFSYEDETPLDMRMDERLSVTAQDLLLVLSEEQLEKIFLEYGEDPQAKRFARAIKRYVKDHPRPTAKEIGEVVRKSSVYRTSKIHPATRVFQALRIAVNSELDNLEVSLQRATRLLAPQGRLVIISFHSLEDALVKNLSRSPAVKPITEKPFGASSAEIERNRSARSAKLRIYEKL